MSDLFRRGEIEARITTVGDAQYAVISENDYLVYIPIKDAPALAKWMLDKCEPKYNITPEEYWTETLGYAEPKMCCNDSYEHFLEGWNAREKGGGE